ncbi:MAG: hypothetical protein LKI42_00555 [Bacteroidales bacterium]|jgi:hypothetical protein|nr:hypothetical protein [Bacteroidales bacterium]MCI1785557.1 hypothetical protein [Bacteroidales bacterium]
MRLLIDILICFLFAVPASSAKSVLTDSSTVVDSPKGDVINLQGSFLRKLQKRDSVLVADQLQYGFRLDGIMEGTRFALPDYSSGFADSASVEVLSQWRIDTLKTIRARKGAPRKYNVEGSVVISAFDAGKYILPRIALKRMNPDGKIDTLVFDPQMLEVKTMPVDTTTFKMHDIKGQIRYPVTFKELLPYIAGFDIFAVLIILVICLLMMRKKKVSGAGDPNEPAHIVALRKLDRFRGDKYWVPEKQKIFYSGITDAIREYIVARYGVEAMEMTTAEIFYDLREKNMPSDLFDGMKQLFERADYVKFAKYTATDEENAAALPFAVRFVTSTYQEQLAQDQEKAESDKKDSDMNGHIVKKDEDDSAYMPK